MPLTLPAFISQRANRSRSRSPADARKQQKPYFPPESHTHDQHSTPPERLHIPPSDPVLVAAEERLDSLPNQREKLLVIRESAMREIDSPESVVLHLNGGIPSQGSDSYNGGSLAAQAVNPLMMPTGTQGTNPGRFCTTGFFGAASQGPILLDSSANYDVTEVVTVASVIDGSPGNTDSSTSDNSRHGTDLPPLASETFKEELYIRGYLKRPASRPANIVQRTSKCTFMFMSRKVFPKVLGRRQGRKVAECLKAEQDAVTTPCGPNAHLSDKYSSTVASVTPRAPHADELESPGTDTNTSAFESFDLHEFSYITAFTTPPSSPSIALDAETLKGGACPGDGKHPV